MPPRLITGAILVFWLAMTGWLIQREVLPMMLAGELPSIQPDLTDEIGKPKIAWTILHRDGQRAGSATSWIVANEQRTLELHSIFNFRDPFLQITKIECMNRVNEEGKLQALSVKFDLESRQAVEIRGEVVDQTLTPRLFHNDDEIKFLDLGTVDMTDQPNVVNPMNLVNRLRGLRGGQTWKITLFDPFRGMKNQFVNDFVKQMMVPALIAEVTSDTLLWDRQEVECYKIEYHEIGKDVTARTWVRKTDGLVLQQESEHLGFAMVLSRMPR
jgi:hypothetical protein